MRRDLIAAGITEPGLQAAYEGCRRINAAHGKTYYLATQLLPPAKRPFVHALYGFARFADDIVDDTANADLAERTRALDQLQRQLQELRATGETDQPVLQALADTVTRWRIPPSYFDAFLSSMRMDLSVSSYPTFAALQRYTYGSAVVIGLQMLPILEPTDFDAAATGAADLANAFQLANFIRDLGEDLDRGRIYLPLDELAEWGVTPATLATRTVDGNLRAALAYQVDRVHRLADSAGKTTHLLHPSVRDCIDTARILYCEIADEVAASGFEVFTHRARVPMSRRLRVAGRGWRNARRNRREFGDGASSVVSSTRRPSARPAGR